MPLELLPRASGHGQRINRREPMKERSLCLAC